MASVIALAILVVFWVWGRIDNWISARALANYRPAPVPKDPTYKTTDISIVVPTKATPALFMSCLRFWALNNPKEIIISTVHGEAAALTQRITEDELIRRLKQETGLVVKVVSVPKGGRRMQLVEGIAHATGRLIATSDDHIQWPSHHYLRDMAACFEDPTVGAAAPVIDVYKIPYAHSRWCSILAGTATLIRPEIVQDPAYTNAFLNDFWRGKVRLDVNDDTFTSRWLQRRGWTIAVQDTPNTTVLRTSRVETRAYFRQIMRWERSSVQHFLRTLRETVERVLRPLISTVHIAAWAATAVCWPQFALLLLKYYVIEALPSYWRFFREYPYMRKYWYAAVAADYVYILQDYWAWATL
ncbi:Polysaccharide synthase [Apiospora aurea]|uniref:Polysaccharide synthase n=1 Tax=Apiospora aurea TaxID=335848 RepID=A0ABR1PXW7_9PEZI